MKAFCAPKLMLPAGRLALVLLLCWWMALLPLAAHAQQDPDPAATAHTAHPAAKPSARNKPSAKITAKKSAVNTSAKSDSDSSAGSAKTDAASAEPAPAGKKLKGASASAASAKSSKKGKKPATRHAPATKAARQAQTAAIRKAFVASSELRPMAQQLATLRSPEVYAAVTNYAHTHTGDAAATAYLALGHAYLLDKRYSDAATAFRQAQKAGDGLDDYADFLAAQAEHLAGNDEAAERLLHGFTERYPDSVFVVEEPELEATVLLMLGRATEANQILATAHGLAAEDRSGFQFATAEVAYTLGNQQEAVRIYKQILLAHPLSTEAQKSLSRLTDLGVESSLGSSDRRTLADAYYAGGRYNEAAEQYRLLARSSQMDQTARNGLQVAAAACDWKLKRLTRQQAELLVDSNDESGARRLYLLMELARDHDSSSEQQTLVSQLQSRFPRSPWLAEALFSSGNMYLLKRDFVSATAYYSQYAAGFPQAKNAALAHWKAAWLNYRLGQFDQATKLIDEQIKLYPQSAEVVAALYWRGRLYELHEQNPAMASANYRAIIRTYPHYFYAQQARVRLAALGSQTPAVDANLDRFQALPQPRLIESFPDASPHMAKARLLANAGLNDSIAREINADPNFANQGDLAAAQIYASYGETFRALRAAKRAIPYAASESIAGVPLVYWRILYPKPHWNTIKTEAARKNVDPYLVLSLMRQESEFNSSVVSYANAWGLMQLLPTTGKMMAHDEGLSKFQSFQLLDPETNIKLGTRYLHQLLGKFNGVQEYTLAAYNAGDNRVVDWEAAGPYRGMDEFVESIPFTQTREYVQSILRNEEMYRLIDEYAQKNGQPDPAEMH